MSCFSKIDLRILSGTTCWRTPCSDYNNSDSQFNLTDVLANSSDQCDNELYAVAHSVAAFPLINRIVVANARDVYATNLRNIADRAARRSERPRRREKQPKDSAAM